MSSIKYNSYKETGLEWLGKIPEHWRVKRIKDVFNEFGSGTTPKSSNPDYYEDGQINWLNTTDLKNNLIFETKVKITEKALIESNLKMYPVNSLAIAMYGQGKTRGSIGLLKVPTTTNQAACIMSKPNDVLPKYIFYWFISKYSDIRQINVGATQPNMNQDFVKFLLLQTPTITEQTEIVKYLDIKTEAIDKKVILFENKIVKYQEIRKALINKTITKGLSPNIKLKESHINWIGQIPEHWKVKRMKDIGFLYSGLSGKSAKDFNQDDNEDNKGFLTFTNIAGNTYINTNDFGKVIIKENEKQNKIKQNDLFFLMSSESYEDVGKASLLVDNVSEIHLNSFCKGFRLTTKDVVPKFLNWMLYAPVFRERLLVQGKGFTRINLKMEKINDFNLIIPSTTKEQIEIANFLDLKTISIDNIITNIKKQIDVLKELRKTLINEVVTGKLKVTEE